MKRLAASLLLVLLVAAAARADDRAAAVSSRDWAQNPAIVQLETTNDIFALGDVHGDFERMVALLGAAGIVKAPAKPEALEWHAGKSVLVITGDMIDKGPDSLSVLRAVKRLEGEAARAGGRVVACLGNHEVALLAGTPKKNGIEQELAAQKIDLAGFVKGEHELGAWLRDRPIAVRVNDWFFSHAGNTDFRTIPDLEKALRGAIEREGFGCKELLRADSIVEARLKPVWWERAGESPEATLDRLLGALKCKHLVIGHQPGHIKFADGTQRAKGELAQKYGRVFMIDTGMSRGVGDSEGALLHVRQDGKRAVATVIKPDGAERALWSE